MADLIYTANVSLDGYVEDAQGNFDFTTPGDDVFAFITDLERSAGTYLYGRRMYETMAVWETMPALAEQSELRAAFADMWQAANKVVYSTTLDDALTDKTRIERVFEVEAVEALKDAADRRLTVGGATLAGQALAAGLVDEVRLFVAPVTVGGGKPALPRDVRLDLELVDERRFRAGTVYLCYRTT
ncbi:MAG TPA: dihydrofolate reductase family protein [Acidimicrobiales bacterium]|nr:dihydrofolate reductase family protein [Acidimicrobiales bacterium]